MTWKMDAVPHIRPAPILPPGRPEPSDTAYYPKWHSNASSRAPAISNSGGGGQTDRTYLCTCPSVASTSTDPVYLACQEQSAVCAGECTRGSATQPKLNLKLPGVRALPVASHISTRARKQALGSFQADEWARIRPTPRLASSALTSTTLPPVARGGCSVKPCVIQVLRMVPLKTEQCPLRDTHAGSVNLATTNPD